MQISIAGQWRLCADTRGGMPLNTDAYREMLTGSSVSSGWFRTPEVRRNGTIIIRASDGINASFGPLRATVDGLLGAAGTCQVGLTCNPTATLAHLIAQWGHRNDFLEWIAALSPVGFFERFGVAPALDNKENWLPDLDHAKALCGPDVFGAFYPIFVDQILALVARVVLPVQGVDAAGVYEDGTDQIVEHRGIEVRLEWGKARAPQIETYIERYHGRAVGVVRSCAQMALNAVDAARVRQHLHHVSFERRESLFSIRSQLGSGRELSVYAKARERIRFEISRPKRARYQPMLLQAPPDRLLQIFRSERNDYLECCDWDAVATLFEETGNPVMSDLVDLVSLVAEACRVEGQPYRPVITALLTDAGMRADLMPVVPLKLVRRLTSAGVIERVNLRRRNKPGELRYALKAEYMAVFMVLMEAFRAE